MIRLPARLVAAALFAGLMAAPAAAQERTADGLTILKSFGEFEDPVYPDGFAHFDYVNPDAPRGGHVVLPAVGTFERLDTIIQGAPWAAGVGLTTDSLMAGSEDELAAYYPLVATEVAVPDDLSYAIFTLNPQARFHDGHPITAEDFVFAFDFLKSAARPLLKEFYSDIVKATALSEHELRLDFASTGNRKTLGIAVGLSPYPKHYWEAEGRDITKSTLEPSLGSGAYMVESVDPGRSITYRRVEDYWAADLPVNVGQNNFDRITYIYFRDDSVMFEAFLGGEYDFRVENRAQRWAISYDTEVVTSGRIQREEIPELVPRGFTGFVFNLRRPIFQDVRVRQALGYLFDFEWTRANVFYDSYARARSYFPNSDYGISDFPLPQGRELELLEPFRDQLPPELFTTPFTVPVTDGSGRIREQLRAALALLGEAGWELRDTVLVNAATGEPFTFEILDGNDTLLRLYEPFIANLKRAGIEARLTIVDTSQYERRQNLFDYDMIYVAANFFPPPGAEMVTYFHSSAVNEQESANWAGIDNPVVDALLENLVAARDLDEIKATTRALDRVLLWNHYIIPSYYPDKDRLAFWDRFGKPGQYPKYSSGFPGTWWLEPDKDARLGLDR